MELSAAISLLRHERLSAPPSARWADLGCGRGLFTTALAELLPEGSTVYAVDKDRAALSRIVPPQRSIQLETLTADFVTDELSLPPLDGVLMANALHFVREQDAFLARAQRWLREDGCFLLVEYDLEKANPWVPYPVPFASLPHWFAPLGYRSIEKLAERPSLYQRAPLYSALVCKG